MGLCRVACSQQSAQATGVTVGNLNGGEAWAACRDSHQNPHHVYAFCFTGCLLMDCEIPCQCCFWGSTLLGIRSRVWICIYHVFFQTLTYSNFMTLWQSHNVAILHNILLTGILICQLINQVNLKTKFQIFESINIEISKRKVNQTEDKYQSEMRKASYPMLHGKTKGFIHILKQLGGLLPAHLGPQALSLNTATVWGDISTTILKNKEMSKNLRRMTDLLLSLSNILNAMYLGFCWVKNCYRYN